MSGKNSARESSLARPRDLEIAATEGSRDFEIAATEGSRDLEIAATDEIATAPQGACG